MPYKAEISRANPTCFLFLVDHSTSMNEPVMGTDGNPKKSEFVAEALNRVLQSLVVSASKDLDIRPYYQVGIIGYGSEIKSILPGADEETHLAWIDEVYQHPLRIEDRQHQEPDGEGGVMDVSVKFPVWVEPYARGNTPMRQVFEEAYRILSQWVVDHPDSYPPTVINLTDGQSNDGKVADAAKSLCELATNDGNVLLITLHTSSHPFDKPVLYPTSVEEMPDFSSRNMFLMTSILPENLRRAAEEILGVEVAEGAHGIVYNADIAGIIQGLEIGTRPANLA
ncbi:vWA domain-containing protein [Leptolinea tardivitalis]|uniref:VWFA domain-containing protein n=1 Tax=Leptolinea tardivitalis TaxID=229920 RepID=A0A0P6WWM5_9CHLR|nr:vWA domain-containing protein [Leptolinea tardivitalis]KPL74669.1 hypothetical protein ADM99_00800 [Leptolinea tardivitalis]GAP22988.1 protein containing von Willebrand factor type A domain [Leptolinea tardivitalis]